MRSRPGSFPASSHCCASDLPSGSVIVVVCENVSVRYHVDAYRSCIARTTSVPFVGSARPSRGRPAGDGDAFAGGRAHEGAAQTIANSEAATLMREAGKGRVVGIMARGGMRPSTLRE